MADVHIPDNILHNVLARLPAKPLLRSRCVSKHWNRLISDPYFMKSRSCRRMLLSAPPCYELDGSLPADNLAYLSELQSLVDIRIAGTINGVVLLLVPDHINVGRTRQMIIYNPLTRASKIVHDPYSSSTHNIYGFCYGDDLKIVRFRDYNHSTNQNWNTCDVFNLKTSIWSTSKIPILNARFMDRDGDYVGMFLNRFLYWIASNKIVALSVEEMVISYVPLPVLDYTLPDYTDIVWGTLHGCFCMITEAENIYDFNVWIMKEHGVENPWSKIHSFRLPLELRSIPGWQVINYAMDDGRICMVDSSNNLVIYDIFKHSYKVLATPLAYVDNCYSHAIEYDESLISLSDICGF